MDFPQFFQRPSRFQFITSRMFRGLAVLTQDPSRKDDEQISPVTGDMFSDNDNAIHVINKPMKVVGGGTPQVGGTVSLPALPGIRYFIHSIGINVQVIAADTCTGVNVQGTVQGTLRSLATVCIVPSVAGAINQPQGILDVLCDENTAVTTYSLTANPTFERVAISYCEVGTAQ